MPDQPVEPTGEAIQASQIHSNTAASAASIAAQTQNQSAASSLRDGLQRLTPATPEPSVAQRAGDQTQVEPPKEKKNFPPVGTSDIAEQKQVESRLDQAADPESALEGFRTGLIKNRRTKERAAYKALNAEQDAKAKDDAAPGETKADAPASSAAPKDEEPPVTSEEIQSTIDDPAISKRHRTRMVFLANRAKELETKLKELEAKPQTDANDAKIKDVEQKLQEREAELVRFRRIHSLPDEPEIKKYDETVQAADTAIYSKLKEFNISDKTIDLIKSMGGFDGFSRSNQTFTINTRDEDGQVIERQVTAAQLARSWLSEMNVGDAEYIKSKMGERFSATDAKARRAKELTEEAQTWFKTKQEQEQRAQQEQAQTMQNNVSAYTKTMDEWAAKQDWLKDKVAGPTATDAERAEVQAYNKHNEGVRALLKIAASPGSVTDYAALVEQAALSQHLRREGNRLAKENEALKEQLANVRKGMGTTPKGGAASIQQAPKREASTAAQQLQTSSSDSLRDAMEKLRLGQSEE
jgi:hypothetical protein